MIRHAVFLGSLLLLSPAWAVNKCTSPDGRVSYQDEACPAGDGRKRLNVAVDAPRQESLPRSGRGEADKRPRPGSAEQGSSTPKQPPRSDKVVHTGPRGGRYTVGPSGRKNYLPRDKK